MKFAESFDEATFTASAYEVGRSAYGKDGIKYKKFLQILPSEAKIAVKNIHSLNYVFTDYLEKLIPKDSNSLPRQISIPTFRDKCTLQLMKKYIQLNFPDIKLEHQLAIIDKLKSSVSLDVVIYRTDISKFYDSLDHAVLLNILRENISDEEFLSLLLRAINNPTAQMGSRRKVYLREKGIAQGIPISNLIANIYGTKIDEAMATTRFFRYMDDMLIVSDTQDEMTENIQLLTSSFNSLKLEQNMNKTILVNAKDGFSFLGYTYDDGEWLIKNHPLENQFHRIAAIIGKYKHDATNPRRARTKTHSATLRAILADDLNRQITGAIFNNKRFGFTFYFSKISNVKQLHHLDKFTQDELSKIQHILGAKLKVKSHVKAYYTWRSVNPSKYIPNYDKEMTTKSKALYLARREVITKAIEVYSSEEIEQRYSDYMRKKLRKLSEFVGKLS